MTNKYNPSRVFVNFLRKNLTDLNSSRSGNWIFADFPRVADLGDSSFPRVGITKINDYSSYTGIYDNTMFDTVDFQIDIVAKKDVGYTLTTTDESLGTISNNPRLYYDEIPTSISNIKHAGTSFGTITAVNTDSDFTSPASLSAGTVEWSKSTGNLNFSSADLTSYSGQAITSTYSAFYEGAKATEFIAKDIIKKVRTSWRTDSTFKPLFYPVKINDTPMPFDEANRVFRRTIEYRVRMYNSMEGI